MRPLLEGQAAVSVHHTPRPEVVLDGLPQGAFILVLTHDHAEDLILCAAALRSQPSYIRLISSHSKWQRFCKRLLEEGHDEEQISSTTSSSAYLPSPARILLALPLPRI
ncbi:XdhC family protein [Arthrobacter alpinus]|uniref:XdhC family protein n=1 Tax=Arthrobacter alpinus TaxID=656366 RepID=UPI0009EBE0DA